MGEMTTVGDLQAYRAVSASEGPWPGLVLVHEIFGLDDEMRRHADRLAAMGFLVLAPDLLARGRKVACLAQTMRALRRGRGQAFDDLEAVRAALLADPSCSGSVGVIGFCLGGGFALLLAGRPGWTAVAANYGALPTDLATLDGACPVVASYGGKDKTLRGTAATLDGALARAGVQRDVHDYPDAGHSFLNRHDLGPGGAILRVAGIGYHEPSAEDAWGRILRFFEAHLRT